MEPPLPYSENDIYALPPPEYTEQSIASSTVAVGAGRTSFSTQGELEDVEELEEDEDREREEEDAILQARVAAASAEGRNPLELGESITHVRRSSVSSAIARRPSFSSPGGFTIASPTAGSFLAQMGSPPPVPPLPASLASLANPIGVGVGVGADGRDGSGRRNRHRAHLRTSSDGLSNFHDTLEVSPELEDHLEGEGEGESHDGHAGAMSTDGHGHAMSFHSRGPSIDGEVGTVEGSTSAAMEVRITERSYEGEPQSSPSLGTEEEHGSTPMPHPSPLPTAAASTRSLPSLPPSTSDSHSYQPDDLQPPHSANEAVHPLPPRPLTTNTSITSSSPRAPLSARSSRPSIRSATSSLPPGAARTPSASETSSLPDGTFLSVASGPLVGLGMSGNARDETRGPRHIPFISSLFRRSPAHQSAVLPTPSSPTLPVAPSSPTSPTHSAHARSQSTPSPLPSPGLLGRSGSLLRGRPRSPHPPLTPREEERERPATAGVGDERANGIGNAETRMGERTNGPLPPPPLPPQVPQLERLRDAPIQFKKPPTPTQIRRSDFVIPAQLQPQPSIVRMDLTLHSLTPNISLSRWAQPL
ncbi:hypothetical protein BT69DRAFT_1067397 [Atractiella rhizophila]|nr:hypothetical protein BT69DRAFT_1067397 [Atractiella rhizophila]